MHWINYSCARIISIASSQSSMPHTLSGTASAASISPHWDSLLVLLDVLEKLERAVELPAIDGLRSLAGVFVRDTEVRTSSAGALAVVDGSCGVSDHRCGVVWWMWLSVNSVMKRNCLGV